MNPPMHAPSLYLDTSVIGGYFDAAFMADTRALWRLQEAGRFRFVSSVLVDQEIAPKKVFPVFWKRPFRAKIGTPAQFLPRTLWETGKTPTRVTRHSDRGFQNCFPNLGFSSYFKKSGWTGPWRASAAIPHHRPPVCFHLVRTRRSAGQTPNRLPS